MLKGTVAGTFFSSFKVTKRALINSEFLMIFFKVKSNSIDLIFNS